MMCFVKLKTGFKKFLFYGFFCLNLWLVAGNCLPLQASDLTGLEAKLQLKQQDFRQLLQDFAEHVTELDSMKTNFESEREKTAWLTMKMQELGTRLNQSQTFLNNKDCQAKLLQASLEREKKRGKELTETALKMRADSIRKECELGESLQQLVNQNKQVVQQILIEKDQLSSSLQEVRSKVASDEQLATNKALEQQLKSLEEKFAAANSSLELLRGHNQKMREEFEEKQCQIEAHASKTVSSLEGKFDEQQQDLEAMHGGLMSLQREKNKLMNQIDELKANNQGLRHQKTDLTLRFLEDRVKVEESLGNKLAQVRDLVVTKYVHKRDAATTLAQQKQELREKLQIIEGENNALSKQLLDLSQQLSSGTARSKQAIGLLLERLSAEQQGYTNKLEELKNLAQTKISDKEQKLQEYQEKFAQLMQDLVAQKKLYSQAFQELKIAQANISILKASTSTNPGAEKQIDPEQQKLAKKLAAEIEKLETKLANAGKREQGLFEKLEVAKQEAEILKSSVDEVFLSNEKLTNDNLQLQQKFGASEQNLLELKTQARELAKREAELIERVVSIEQQINVGKAPSKQLSDRLNLARDDYAKLKDEVIQLTQKLIASSQIANQLRTEASQRQEQMEQMNAELVAKLEETGQLKEKMRLLLANLGLQIDQLATEGKTDYLRLVADHQQERLVTEVLRHGKAKMEPGLNQIIDDDELLNNFVARLQQKIQLQQNCSQQSNFGTIFQALNKNALQAELSKLYSLFLARGSTGKAENPAYKQFLQLSATYFGEPELVEVPIGSLNNPQNLLLIKIIG